MSDSIEEAALPRSFQATAAMATGAMLDAIPGYAAVLDARGTIAAGNNAWRSTGDDIRFAATGSNYLRALRKASADGAREVDPLIASLEKILSGKVMNVVTDHPWPAHGPTQRWTFVAQRSDRRGGILVIHSPTPVSRDAAEDPVSRAGSDRVVQLAVAGELLHAMTHDLRQPLAALRLNLAAALELVRRDAPQATEAAAAIADAIDQEDSASRRMAAVEDLVAFRPPKNEPVDLSALAEEVVRVGKTEAISRRVRFQSRLSSELPSIVGDRRLIRTAVLGLVLDALGALTETPPDRVTLTTRRVDSEVELAVCRYADDAVPSADWVLNIARAVANVDPPAISVDSDTTARSCVRLRWRVGS